MKWMAISNTWRRWGVILSLVIVSVTQLSCDETGDVYLKGSIVENYGIKFDDVQIRLYDGELSVEYTKKATEGTVALRVTVDTTAAQLAKGKTYNLMLYGTVSRDEGFGALPELESGTLTLNEYREKDGAEVAGTFESKFIAPSGSLQNLRGGFVANLEIVNF